jgi:type II secretory pathway predicted ATPase ExeA
VTVRTRPTIDRTNPPEGVRINLGSIAPLLGVSMTDLHNACGVSRAGVFNLISANRWPAGYDAGEIRGAIEALLCDRGATPDQIATLWHARKRNDAPRRTDGFNRPLDADGNRIPQPQPEEPEEMLLPKQTLTPQARRHFKVFTNPFDGEVVKDEQMFDSPDVRYVREAVWQCCQTSAFVAVVGESGSGKTTIQADLEERIARSGDQITVIKPSVLGMEPGESQGAQLRSADILHAICSTLAPAQGVPQTMQARTLRAHKLLAASAQIGNVHLLVVEEAHAMPSAALKHLKRLHELRNGRRPLLGILLLAQPELRKRLTDGLRDGSLREVAQRCEIVELLPLDTELRAYLECRAAAAGAKLDALIDAAGVEALRQRLTIRRDGQRKAVSLCYPLAVNNLMTSALNAAAELGAPLVTRELVAGL